MVQDLTDGCQTHRRETFWENMGDKRRGEKDVLLYRISGMQRRGYESVKNY